MTLSLAYDMHTGPCAAHRKSLTRVASFEISTYTPTEGQHLWNEAFCCPTCGSVWAQEFYLGASSRPRWAFTPRECGSHILSAEHFDYYLISENLSRPAQEFLIHEYARCFEYYRAHTSHLRHDL